MKGSADVDDARRDKRAVVPQTADAALLDKPLRGVADVEAIEAVPLDDRLRIVDISHRVACGLAGHDPSDTAIFYVPDGDVDRPAVEISFSTLIQNIGRTAALLRGAGIGPGDVVAVLLPAVPQIYWAILGAMSAAVVFPINWMLEPQHVLHLIREAGAKAVIALGPTPDFRIWESLMTIVGELTPCMRIWSVTGPEGDMLPDSDLDVHIARHAHEPANSPARTVDDIAVYMHSGGTTGLPKIVKISNRNASYRHWTLQLAYKAALGELLFHDSPLFHSGGLSAVAFRRWQAGPAC
jgi:fatty-acyl-CoA synthase